MKRPKLPAFVKTTAFVYAVCLFGAFLLWHYIHANNNHRAVFTDIPISWSFGSFTNGMVTASSVQKVTVFLSGSLEDVTAISENDIKCNLLLAPQPTNKTYSLSSDNISLPGKMRFGIEIEPKTCTVETDSRISKNVDVFLTSRNNLPEGYVQGAHKFDPENVRVSGPASLLEKSVFRAETQPLDLSSLTRSLVHHSIDLKTNANYVMEPKVVSLNLTIVPSEMELNLPPAPIALLAPLGRPLQLQVVPQTAVVRVKGTSEALKRLREDEMLVFVDARDLLASSVKERPVRAKLPSGVSLVSVDPLFATITVQEIGEP